MFNNQTCQNFSFQDSVEPGPSSSPVMTGGGTSADPLLDFQLQPLDARRTWKNVVNKQRFDAILQSHRDHTDQDDVGREVTQALRRTIERQTAGDDTLTPHSTLHFAMQSNTFTHAFQSTTFSVQEFQDGSDRLDTYLQALADKLNSNEEFAPDDSFTMEMTFIHTPGPGSGNGNRHKPATATILGIAKNSIVTIKNSDALCCARAIVTMKAYVDANYNSRDPDYKNLNQGRPIQGRRARELHRLAGVPEGPCGIPELKKFQAALPHHRIKVISLAPPYQVIFDGAPFGTKIIRLIKVHDHYNGCNSFNGFLSNSYFCDDCNRGYNTDDFKHHPCKGKWCRSCERKDCPDFIAAKQACGSGNYPKPQELCRLCHREFHGTQCYNYHLQRRDNRKKRSICEMVKKCPHCRHVYRLPNKDLKVRLGPAPKDPHKCGWAKCSNCKKEVDMTTHKCYIQRLPKQDDAPRYNTVTRDKVNGRYFKPHPPTLIKFRS